jgi:hypothetical protein
MGNGRTPAARNICGLLGWLGPLRTGRGQAAPSGHTLPDSPWSASFATSSVGTDTGTSCLPSAQEEAGWGRGGGRAQMGAPKDTSPTGHSWGSLCSSPGSAGATASGLVGGLWDNPRGTGQSCGCREGRFPPFILFTY